MEPENRSNNRQIETQFGKGKSGNPGGRPKRDPAEVAKWVEAANKNLDVLVGIRDNSEKDTDRIRAIEIIEDRAYGKPLQQIDAQIDATITEELAHDQRQKRLLEIEAELARLAK